MLAALSTWLEHLYCLDAPGTAPASSMVLVAFQGYPDFYSVSQLQNLPPDPSNPAALASLWDRLAQKINGVGGCTVFEMGFQALVSACNAVQPPSERLRCSVK